MKGLIKMFKKIFYKLLPYIRIRDGVYLLMLTILIEFSSAYLAQVLPSIAKPITLLFLLLGFAVLTLVYLGRWFKIKTGKSLYGALLSPDREGNLIQLISRARKEYADMNRFQSKGWNTELNGEGIVLGKDKENRLVTSPVDSEEHILCVGGSGSGKTSSVLIPSALRYSNGGIFAIDISSDIYNNVRSVRDIAKIDPHSNSSAAFNVFFHIDKEKDKSKKIILIKKLANLILPEFDNTKSHNDNAYFQQGSHLLLYASIIYYYSKGYDFCNLCFEIISKTGKELISMLKGKDSPPNSKLTIKSLADIRDINLASMKQTLDAYISVFATSRPVKRILHRKSKTYQAVISADELEERDIFLCIPQREIVFFSPLMRLISGLVLDYCGSRPLYPERKILISLDEFSSLGFLDIINPLANLRKHGTRIMILTQSLADIDDIYGMNKRRTIFDNCSIKIILSAKDLDTQEFFSRLIGTYEEEKQTRMYSDGESRHSYTTVEKPIIPPEELGYLRDDCIILLPDGYLKLKKAYFFEDFS